MFSDLVQISVKNDSVQFLSCISLPRLSTFGIRDLMTLGSVRACNALLSLLINLLTGGGLAETGFGGRNPVRTGILSVRNSARDESGLEKSEIFSSS